METYGGQRSLTGTSMHVSSTPVLVPKRGGLRRSTKPAQLFVGNSDDEGTDCGECGTCRLCTGNGPLSSSPSMPPSFGGVGDSLRERGLAALKRTPPPTPKGLGNAFPSMMKSSKSHHNFGEFALDNNAASSNIESDDGSDSGGIAAALTAQRRGRATIARVSTVQNLTSWGMEDAEDSDDGDEFASFKERFARANGQRQQQPAAAVVSESLRD